MGCCDDAPSRSSSRPWSISCRAGSTSTTRRAGATATTRPCRASSLGDARRRTRWRSSVEATALENQIGARIQAELDRLRGGEVLFDRVVVKIENKDESAGGILLPENRKQRPVTGLVAGVGSETKHVKVGDRVLFMAYAGVEVELPDGDKLVD